MTLGPTDQLAHVTMHIFSKGPHGEASGSGFILDLSADPDRHAPFLITNKHVIEGRTQGRLRFTMKNSEGGADFGNNYDLVVDNFEASFIKHPDTEVDLAALPLAALIDHLKSIGKTPYYLTLPFQVVADQPFLETLDTVEDVLMVGYPSGLWDHVNNLPLVRRGVTATAPSRHFSGKPQFVIDCACFPGSSGSPVFLYNANGYRDKKGNTFMGTPRVMLLGILWGGPQHDAQGTLSPVPVPTSFAISSKIPNNLGFCVRADQLNYFKKVVEEQPSAD